MLARISKALEYHSLIFAREQVDFVFLSRPLGISNVADVKDIDSILAKLEKMENNYKAESAKIKAGLAQIRKDNCFDTLFETLDKIIKDYE